MDLRTHSPNPNAPDGSHSQANHTTQINTDPNASQGPKRYRLPDGTWKPLSAMTAAEKAACHMDAGN